MRSDFRQEGVLHVAATQVTSRDLLQRALRMRALGYLAQQKARLLTQTIFEVGRSKDELQRRATTLLENQETIQRQKAELEARAASLEAVQRTLEERVRKSTDELARANAALGEEALIRERILSESERLSQKYLRAQKLELVGRLASGVAHDFNNLLTVMLGYAELGRIALATSAPVAPHLDAIMDAVRRASSLTRQLLTFARRQPRKPTVIDLGPVIEDFAQLLQRVLGEKITLELRIAPDVGNVRAGVSELEQVILNLVVNARDAMPVGGTIFLTLNRVIRPDSGPLPHGPCAEIRVKDTGEGMSEEAMKNLFQPFFTTKPAGIGTGLGLATVDTIVRDCDGQIEVESRCGVGTTFRVYLPLIAQPSEMRRIVKDFGALPRGDELVLIIDDDESIRVVLRQMFQVLGYRVFTAESAGAALEILGRERIDLILVDTLLPGTPGEALVAEAAVRWPTTRVLFMSGYTDRPRPLDAVGRTHPFVEKPLELAQLADAVRKVLDRSGEAEQRLNPARSR